MLTVALVLRRRHRMMRRLRVGPRMHRHTILFRVACKMTLRRHRARMNRQRWLRSVSCHLDITCLRFPALGSRVVLLLHSLQVPLLDRLFRCGSSDLVLGICAVLRLLGHSLVVDALHRLSLCGLSDVDICLALDDVLYLFVPHHGFVLDFAESCQL